MWSVLVKFFVFKFGIYNVDYINLFWEFNGIRKFNINIIFVGI